MTFEINKVEDWEEVVKEIIPCLKSKILLLKGNLGAGKTTFTKSLVNEYHFLLRKTLYRSF